MVHERVRAAVEKSGLKQKAIAERIGVSEQTLSAMLSGRRKIDVDEFFKLCLVLGLAPNELYGYPQTLDAEAV